MPFPANLTTEHAAITLASWVEREVVGRDRETGAGQSLFLAP